jgi:hypothetical protein
MWLQRKAINNSTFRNEHDIGKAVNNWTIDYNVSHGKRIAEILQIGVIDMIT